MPRFVDPDGRKWIGLHSHDGGGEYGIEHARASHEFAARRAFITGVKYHEIADKLGEPCTIFPNSYDPEIRPVRVENRG